MHNTCAPISEWTSEAREPSCVSPVKTKYSLRNSGLKHEGFLAKLEGKWKGGDRSLMRQIIYINGMAFWVYSHNI